MKTENDKKKTKPPLVVSREVINALSPLEQLAAQAAVECGYWIIEEDQNKPKQKKK